VPASAVLIVAAALALLAGCGQSKEDKFKADFKPLNDELLKLGKDVGRGVTTATGKTDAQLAGEFGGFARRTGDLRGRIDDLDPPDKLRADHRRLVAALGSLQTDLSGIQAAATRHNARAAGLATRALISDSERERTSRTALARATGAKVR
jgi:hypothetical protein